MEEMYNTLRRHPDGRSLGVAHDFVWQACTTVLGRYSLSAAEFEGIMDTLLGSARGWGERPISRNYLAYLHCNL